VQLPNVIARHFIAVAIYYPPPGLLHLVRNDMAFDSAMAHDPEGWRYSRDIAMHSARS